ncbi:hypothetical protein [Streptomyces otsuchiensis]|uniref:hypothetical protein n=1 Tax=Streptomyces otsuchiensis TaxID=2681388 RepID=UPI0013001B40|nr:hypothetical protein [Streptomyces otsuchiensis]
MVVVLACAAAAVWWGDTAHMLPNLAGGPAIPVEASHVLPVLVAAVVVLSSGDGLRDFSEHAARPRRLILAAHLAAGLGVAAVLITLALVVGGAADQAAVALRNLVSGSGLAALGAALVGVRTSWALPLALATPALTIADPASPSWWHWPTAAGTPHSWFPAVLVFVVGVTALLLRTAPYGRVRVARRERRPSHPAR